MISWLRTHEPLSAQPYGQIINLQNTTLGTLPAPLQSDLHENSTCGAPVNVAVNQSDNWCRLCLTSSSPNNGDIQRRPTFVCGLLWGMGAPVTCGPTLAARSRTRHSAFRASLCDSWALSAHINLNVLSPRILWVLLDNLRSRRVPTCPPNLPNAPL